jgi:hypothetical protein
VAIVLPYNLTDGTLADAVQVMANLNALKESIEGVGAASTATDVYQTGVLATTDWTPGAVNVTGGTGEIELTTFGGAAWLPAPVSGLVRTFTTAATYKALKPPVLPGPTGFIRCGIELTASGAAATVSIVSGTEKATEAEALAIAASPAISSGKARVLDIIIKNVAGTYSLVTTRERRRFATGLERSIIATSESRTNTAFGTLSNPDEVEVTMPENGLIAVAYHATWGESVESAARAAIFLGANQLKKAVVNEAVPVVQEVSHGNTATQAQPLYSTSGGLYGELKTTGWVDVTTGQVLGGVEAIAGAPCFIFGAAGTYKVSVQFKSSSGSVTVLNRKLWAWTVA